jgi:hypothetical protein
VCSSDLLVWPALVLSIHRLTKGWLVTSVLVVVFGGSLLASELMLDAESGQAHTAHTMNKVPLLLVNAPAEIGGLADGSLADIAPTILDLLGLDKPAAMTGHSLLRGLSTSAAAQ